MLSALCETCNKKYKVDDKLAGKKLKCKACGGVVKVPLAASAPPSPKTPSVKAPPAKVAKPAKAPPPEISLELPDIPPLPPAPVVDLLPDASADDLLAPAPKQSAPPCPSCGKPFPEANRICLSCGFNRATGKKASRQLIGQSAAEESNIRENPGYKDPYLKLTDVWTSISLCIVGLVAANWYWLHYLYQVFTAESTNVDGVWKIHTVQVMVYMAYAVVILVVVMGLPVMLIAQAGNALKFKLPESAYQRMIASMSIPLILFYFCDDYFRKADTRISFAPGRTIDFDTLISNHDNIYLFAVIKSALIALVILIPLFLFLYRLFKPADFIFSAAVVLVIFVGGLVGDYYVQKLGTDKIVGSVAESVGKARLEQLRSNQQMNPRR